MRVEVNHLMRHRKASVHEANQLNQLIVRSRTHIGYDAENNNDFLQDFGINENYIEKQFTYVYEINTRIIAMYGLSFHDHLHLDYFFLEPHIIRQGLGRKMWQTLCEFIRNHNKTWKEFQFISNPHAIPFYLQMGAQIVTHYGDINDGMKIMHYHLPT